MAHFNHPTEMTTDVVKKAIKNILGTGAQIRTQSPIMKHINDDPFIWEHMWKEQVRLGMIPYYMFIARDTGAQHYFNVSLDRAVNIYRKAYSKVSGVCRTVRGPSMSASPGKIQIISTVNIKDEKLFLLQFLQGRNPEWVKKPFFAKFNPDAVWLTDLEPALGKEKFFWEDEYNSMYDLKHEELYPNMED
jgi:L-lysine 2,3-aminomutase